MVGHAWDILTDEAGKYISPPVRPVGPSAALRATKTPAAAELQAQEDFEVLLRTQQLLPPEEQWAVHRGERRLILQRPLGADLWKRLEARCVAGDFEAGRLVKEANAAVAAMEMQHFLDTLRTELQEDETPESNDPT